jgi:hypothetical protein
MYLESETGKSGTLHRQIDQGSTDRRSTQLENYFMQAPAHPGVKPLDNEHSVRPSSFYAFRNISFFSFFGPYQTSIIMP